MWSRLAALIVKELLAILRDPRGRVVLIAPPLMQLVIFSYAATLEVRNVDLVVLDRDAGRWSAELVARVAASPSFRSVTAVSSPGALREAIDRRRAIAALSIPPDFSRAIEAGRPASVQAILDGRRSNASQIVGGYIERIVAGLAAETPAGLRAGGPPVVVEPRNWFNPNLEYQWFMVPNLVASIALLMGIIVTALSIARERELGTFDQLMVSPLRTHEILIGKLVPPILIGLFHMSLYILAATFIFEVPLRGSLPLFYVAAVAFMASVAGLGLLISALSATQQQAILGAFVVLVPAMLLSGFATPIANMPQWLQTLTYANPLRYFLIVVRGTFLKDIDTGDALALVLPLMLIAVISLAAAAWLFRRRLE